MRHELVRMSEGSGSAQQRVAHKAIRPQLGREPHWQRLLVRTLSARPAASPRATERHTSA